MATKLELEQENIELQRQLRELRDQLPLQDSAAATSPQGSEIEDLLRKEIQSLSEKLASALTVRVSLEERLDESERICDRLRHDLEKKTAERLPGHRRDDGTYEVHQLMTALELVEKVKYQYLDGAAIVAEMKKI